MKFLTTQLTYLLTEREYRRNIKTLLQYLAFLAGTVVLLNITGKLQAKLGNFRFGRIFFSRAHGLLHQLQGPNPIPGNGIDILAAAAMMAAVEFTGHHISPVVILAVTAGRIPQQSPVV